MKAYNKPVVEISGFEVEDIITASVFGENDAAQGVYRSYVESNGGEIDEGDNGLYYTW